MDYYPGKHKQENKRSQTDDSLIYGVHPVAEALQSGREIDKILVKAGLSGTSIQEILHMARTKGIPIQQVPQEKLDGLVRAQHQGIAALLPAIVFRDFQEILRQSLTWDRPALIVLVDGVTDVRNLGAIARSASCFGAQALVVPTQGSARINAEAVKSSAGALNHLPVARVDSLLKAITALKELDIQVIGLTEKSNTPLADCDLIRPTALIFGSEGQGLSVPVLRWADHLVKIPMTGPIASLNVSAAAAISFYEVFRQRM